MNILPYENLTYYSVLPPNGIRDLLSMNISSKNEFGGIAESKKFSGDANNNQFKIRLSAFFPQQVYAIGIIEEVNKQSKLSIKIRWNNLIYVSFSIWVIVSLAFYFFGTIDNLSTSYGINFYLFGLVAGIFLYLLQYHWQSKNLKSAIRKTLMASKR